MKRLRWPLSAVIFLLLLLVSFPAAASYDTAIRTAREFLWKSVTSGGINSCSAAILDGGEIVYSEGFGTADRAEGIPADGKTRFNIGSTSKMFAAAAILILADENRLGLDDPVIRHLPEFSMKDPRYRDITIRMLFNHSSGLPGSTFVFGYRDDQNPHAVLLDTLRESTLKHDPGAMGIYCNDGFTLAEMIVERVSGKPFLGFLKERVFDPLGMKDTGASIGISGGKVAEFYDEKGKKLPRELVAVLGAGGLSSTVEDLCRFSGAFIPGGKSFLSEKMREEILRPQPTPFAASLRGQSLLEAFGWDYALLPEFRDLGFQMVGKSGGTSFYTTNIQILPSRGLAVAVIFSGHGPTQEATCTIMKALMRDKILQVPEKPRPVPPAAAEPVPLELLAHEGYYVDASRAAFFSFDREKGLLNIHPLSGQSDGSSPAPLVLQYNGGYFHDFERNRKYYFTAAGGETFLVFADIPQYGGDVLFFQKVPVPLTPVHLAADVDGRVWFLRNASPFLQSPDILLVRSSRIAGLPGYIDFFGIKRVESQKYAAIAATGFRDQCSLSLFKKGNETRVKVMQFVFSGEDSVPTISGGKVVIGPEGENEWRRSEGGAVLSFVKPEDGRVIVLSGTGDFPLLFDSITDEGEIYVPEGSFLFFAGDSGDIFEVVSR